MNKINLNGIESIHDNSSGFNVVKVKLGYQNLYDDIEKMEKLSSIFSEKVKFRIDVNGQLDLTKAIRFCKSMEKFNIDISIWEVGEVTNMSWMFYEATNFNQNISNFRVIKYIN